MEQVDFVGAIESLAKRFGVEIEYEEISPEAEQARRRKERLTQLLERATEFYERVLWDSEQGRVRARVPRVARPGRGGLPRVPARLRAGRRRRSTRAALGRATRSDELLAAGLANRRGNDYFQRRLVFPLADARGRVRGFQARKLHDDDPLQAKYVNSPESDVFKKGDLLYGLDTRAAGDREAGPRGRRRGEHRRARAAPGGLRAGRRVDGHGAHRARSCAS